VVGPDAYFMGIIDFHQKWTLRKKVKVHVISVLILFANSVIVYGYSYQLERFFKVHFKGADPNGLSAIEPDLYMERFDQCIDGICFIVLY
jgi:hypothetical protein